jgi:hypothetical protein
MLRPEDNAKARPHASPAPRIGGPRVGRAAMLTRAVRLIAALAGAALLSQFPAFYDQYLQRLGGRLDQARIEATRVEIAARQENLSVPAYIEVFLRNEASPIRRQGQVMRDQYADLVRLEAAFAALREAPIAARPVRFAGHMNNDVASKTLEDFQPALPLGIEGLTYALLGLLSGLLGARAGGRAVSAVTRRAMRTRRA